MSGRKLFYLSIVLFSAVTVSSALLNCTSGEQKSIPMEKWVSPQGVVSVLKPKEWNVEENYTGNSSSIVVCDDSRITGITFFVSRNDSGIRDSLCLLGESVKKNRKKFPDFKCNNTWAARDKSKAITDISYTAKGIPVLGKFYYFVNPNQVLFMSYQSPGDKFSKHKGIFLTILNNINFYDQYEEQKRSRSIEKQVMQAVQPVQAQMVWRQAPDGSARFMAPANWQYQAQKGKTLVGSEQEDAGFVFTSVESFAKDHGVRVPGVLISRYLPPDQFVGLFLKQFGKAGNVQVIEKIPDHRTVQQAAQVLRSRCEAQDLVVKFSSKSGRSCLSTFKVITAHPALFSGQWWSIVGGFWAPESRFAAYAPLLEKIAKSYQVNDVWAKNYIQSGLANLRRLKQKTQQAIQKLHQARYDQQRSWEANQARKDYSNWKFSQYLRGKTSWVSDLEGGKVYHTDSWGTKDTWTGDYYEGSPYNYVNFKGRNPKHPSLEDMQEINSFELYQKYIQGQ
ncbi:MAG: hypothetical protein PVG37_01015 [Desulfobacterales bacterium]|jgi:hypothetical protein